MKNEPAAPTQPLEPTFDRTPQPFGSGPPDPIVCDASARSLRRRTVNFAAKRMIDMLYVSGLDRETAEHLALAWNDPTLMLSQVATRFGCHEGNILGRRHAIEQHGFRLRAR